MWMLTKTITSFGVKVPRKKPWNVKYFTGFYKRFIKSNIINNLPFEINITVIWWNIFTVFERTYFGQLHNYMYDKQR